jgi:selT/selW/selH-like putative selenoprotein
MNQKRDHHHLLFPVQLDAARQLDGAGAVTYLQHRYRLGDAGAGTGGIFTIDVDGQQIWERKQDGGFPDAAELKRRVRDVCFPEKPLGHVDKGDQKVTTPPDDKRPEEKPLAG